MTSACPSVLRRITALLAVLAFTSSVEAQDNYYRRGVQPQQPGIAASRYQTPSYGAPAVRRPALPGRIRQVQFEQPMSAPAAQTAIPMPAANPVAADGAVDQPAQGVAETLSATTGRIPPIQEAQPNEHPLAPAIRWARTGFETIDKLEDYSCTLVKRERIGDTLGEHEYLFVKVRHKPFSVYTYFLGPARVKGQEAVYVEGLNGGNMQAHGNGVKHRLFGTVSLKPTSMMAMSGNRYPITEMGIRRLTERLIEIGTNDMNYGECNVNVIQGAKVNNRTCTCIQVVHPVPRKEFLFHLARIYVDDEMQLPMRYEAYDWPREAGGQPQLTEEYTFLNLKLNNGFTDADFSVENPNYAFR